MVYSQLGLPVNALPQSVFQHQVKPYPSGTAVAFTERVRYIHFHIFVCNVFKRIFRHTLYVSQSLRQVLRHGKLKTAFCYVHIPYLACKII